MTMVRTFAEAVQGLKHTLNLYVAGTNLCIMKACNLKEVVVWAWKDDDGQVCTIVSTNQAAAGILNDVASHITAGTPESEIDLAVLIANQLQEARSCGLVLRDGFIMKGFEALEIFDAILLCELLYWTGVNPSDG